MAHQTIEFKFTGLDQDSDPRLMLPGDSRYRLNCVNDSTDAGLLGDIQNIKGNVAYPHTAPTGTNIAIGSVKDIQNNAIIYFVYNSNGDHQIRRFFPDLGTDQLIIQSDVLNFQPTSKIYHVDVVGELLYWTDGWFEDYGYGVNNQLNYNPPRKINIAKAIAGDPGYAPLTFETLDRIKYQPSTPAELRYLNNATQIENYLLNKMFQFTYRYIFDDKEVSTWATLSKVLLPAYNFKDGNGGNVVQLLENNIGVTIQSGSPIVTDIEIAIRSSVTNVDGGASYFIVSRLDKAELGIADNIAYEYIYDGVAFKENLSTDDFLRPFDYVPQISHAQFYAGGRLVDWNEVENYDNEEPDITAEFIRYDKTLDIRTTSPDPSNPSNPNTTTWGSVSYNQYPLPTFKQLGIYQYGKVYYDRAGRSGVVSTKDTYQILAPSIDDGSFPFNGVLGDPLKLRLTIGVNDIPPIWATHWAPVITKELSYIKKQQFIITENQFDYETGELEIPASIGYTFEEGDTIRLIGYSKAQVNFLITQFGQTLPQGAITFDDIEAYPDWFNDQFFVPPTTVPYGDSLITQATSTFNYRIKEYDAATLKASFSDDDTINIKTYFDNHGTGPFNIIPESYFYILEVYNKNRDSTDNKIFFEVGQKFEVGDPYLPTRYHKAPEQDQIPGAQTAIVDIFGFDCYLRRKKQTVAVFPVLMTGAVSTVISGGDLYISFPESYLPFFKDANLSTVTIISYDGTPPGLLGDYDVQNNISFETPTIGESLGVFYTVLKQNGGSFTPDPARPVFYAMLFETNVELYPWLEDDAFADDYDSTVYNDGRPNSNLETLGRKDYFARGRWSEQLFENTLINGLSTVLGGSYKDLSERYGPVSRIRQVGDTLRVRQKSKMTSFYLNKNMLNVNEGVASVGQSSDFLSTPNLYDEEYGSSSPGADIDNGIRTNYLIDLLRGIVIRDAGNKPGIISGDTSNAKDPFKMEKYFRDLFQQIRESGEENFNIIAAWDDFSQLYTLTIQNLGEVDLPQSQTIVFHEPTNRWKSFMSYVPEWYETLGKYLVSFKNGQPYIHYENPLYNNFFGVQYGQELRVTSSLARNTIKVFNNMDLYSNIAWEIPAVTIPSSPNYPNGMLSRIPAARFVAKEGVWHAPFFRDQNDPKYAHSVTLALTQGRRLRGETIELTMTNTSTSLVYVKALNIFVEQSELTI